MSIEETYQYCEQISKQVTSAPREVLGKVSALANNLLDELSDDLQQLEKERLLIARASAMNIEAECLSQLGENKKALQTVREARKILETIQVLTNDRQFRLVLARTHEIESILFWKMGDYVQAETAIEQCIKDYEDSNDNDKYFNALNLKASILASTGKLVEATTLFLTALRYFEESGNKKKSAILLHNISGIYYESHQFDLALQAVTRAIENIDNQEDPQCIDTYYAKAMIHEALHQHELAEKDVLHALSLSKKYDYLIGQIKGLAELGKSYLRKNELDKALENFQEALRIQKQTQSLYFRLETLLGLAQSYQRKGDWQQAKATLEELRLSAEEQKNDQFIAQAYLHLCDCAEHEGDLRTALDYHKQFANFQAIHTERLIDERFQQQKAALLTEQTQRESEEIKLLNERLLSAHDTLAEVICEIELQKTDLELQYSRITQLLNVLSEGVLIEDEHRKTLFVNQSLLNLFEIKGTPQNFIQKSADRLRVFVRHRVEESKAAREFFETAFYNRQSVLKKEVKQINGKVYEFSFIPLFKQESYRGSLWIFEDVTLRKNQERERELVIESLTQANKTLQKANQLKTELVGMAVHDLKNPLSLILGFVELMKNEQESERWESYLQAIERSAQRMLNLVQELLRSAQSETETVVELQQTNVNEILRYLIANQEVLAKEKSISIKFNEQSLCTVYAVPEKLYEIFENLLSNAIKYSPAGKHVEVTVEKRPVEQSKMRRQSDRELTKFGVVRVSFKDEGQGLSEEDFTKIFQPFQRLSAKPTANENSTGLGLYIVKNLVEKYHGKVWAESEGIGKGATFFVELPAAE